MRLCFFTKLPDNHLFETVDFYRNDIQIFKRLGFDVYRAGNIREIDMCADVYVSWFPYWGALIEPLATLRRKPHITIGNVDAALPPAARRTRWQDAVLAIMEGWCVKHADACVATSNYELPIFRNLRARHVSVVHHGIDSDYYKPNPETQGRDCRVLTITHVNEGNYIRKCIGTIVAAVPLVRKRFPEVRFVIGGRKDPVTAQRIESLARAAGVADAIELPGLLSMEQKLVLMQSSRVYLQPSLHEGFGVAIAEAMSCGLPVVSSPAGAVGEVLGGAGLYASGNDPVALADRVCDLLSDGAKRTQCAMAGRARIVELFSLGARQAAIARILDDVLVRYKMQR